MLDGEVIRFTRRSGSTTYSVCYVVANSELPKSPVELVRYQDHLVGLRYFDGPKSLQWNTYLYFVVSDAVARSEDIIQTRAMIEADRVYARKYVVTEAELDGLFGVPAAASSLPRPSGSIMSVWHQVLSNAGLDPAIVQSGPLPQRLSLIESPRPKAAREIAVASVGASSPPPKQLKSFELSEYRPFPRQRKYSFGRVNLVTGPNGAGKTSLLEAIELFYCGRTHRDPTSDSPYQIDVVYEDGSKETAKHSRPLQEFRDRNLRWYGQAEVKTNHLHQSFALFNYLNTDAAVGIADSAELLDEKLAALLVGSETAQTWKEIERIYDAALDRINVTESSSRQLKEELVSLEATIREATSVRKESDSILATLRKMSNELGWTVASGNGTAIADAMIRELSELESVASQAASLAGVGTPANTSGLRALQTSLAQGERTLAAQLEELERVRKREADCDQAYNRARLVIQLLESAHRVTVSGLPQRLSDLQQQQLRVASIASQLAGFDPSFTECFVGEALTKTVHEAATSASDSASRARLALEDAKRAYASFADARERSVTLAEQLRSLAAELFQVGHPADQCPLCRTRFAAGELANRLSADLDSDLAKRGEELLTSIRASEAKVKSTERWVQATAWLRAFCTRSRRSESLLVSMAIEEADAARKTAADAAKRVETLQREVATISAGGVSTSSLDRSLAELRELGIDPSDGSAEALIQHIQRERVAEADCLAELQTARSLGENIQATIAKSMGVGLSTSLPQLAEIVRERREVRVRTEALLAKLDRFSESCPWPPERSLSELVVEVRALRRVANELQVALGREAKAQGTLKGCEERRKQVASQMDILTARLDKLSHAREALDTIRGQHSLQGAVEAALSQNRKAIEAVFCRIHSPAEFENVTTAPLALVRKSNGESATLKQVSTGQRAAFALALFLSQNAHVTEGPPVLLIDDPIAHVDDMNALSFLDYLRELVVARGRQVFFATASEKLAILFERKFDFLGRQFEKIKLAR